MDILLQNLPIYAFVLVVIFAPYLVGMFLRIKLFPHPSHYLLIIIGIVSGVTLTIASRISTSAFNILPIIIILIHSGVLGLYWLDTKQHLMQILIFVSLSTLIYVIVIMMPSLLPSEGVYFDLSGERAARGVAIIAVILQSVVVVVGALIISGIRALRK